MMKMMKPEAALSPRKMMMAMLMVMMVMMVMVVVMMAMTMVMTYVGSRRLLASSSSSYDPNLVRT